MTINKALLALALGFALTATASAQDMISQTATTNMLFQAAMTDTSQPMTREQAKAQAQRNARVSLPPKQGQAKFTQEAVKVDGYRVSVMEDWKHENVCYIANGNSADRPTIACVPMH